MGDVVKHGPIELRCGDWREVLADVTECDAVITDPPYSWRTHKGHDAAVNMTSGGSWARGNGGQDKRRTRREIVYPFWRTQDVGLFAEHWADRCLGWVCAFSDSCLTEIWRSALEGRGRTGFHPLPCVIKGMSVRLCGDGPSSWAIYLNVARPKALSKWGTLPGAYTGGQGEREHIGGKPLWLMRAIIRDYTRPGDLVVDPCAGGATTLIAAAIEGRRAIGAEISPETFSKAAARIRKGWTPDLFTARPGSDRAAASQLVFGGEPSRDTACKDE
jgi:site-specific DNA-methyltransferase (adenine-specific)